MNKKEYITRQTQKTKNKKYEAYVVTRIIHLLNDFTIKETLNKTNQTSQSMRI